MDRLERFASGDLDAFEDLFRQFQSEVYGWILRIVRNRSAAEDLTVEAFWRIYRARARFDPTRSFGAWARRIATNLAIDYVRGLPAEVRLPRNLAEREEPNPALRRETADAIARAWRLLPGKLQAAATLALIEERSYGEIAEALGTSVGTVKSRVFRAVRALRKRLLGMGIEP